MATDEKTPLKRFFFPAPIPETGVPNNSGPNPGKIQNESGTKSNLIAESVGATPQTKRDRMVTGFNSKPQDLEHKSNSNIQTQKSEPEEQHQARGRIRYMLQCMSKSWKPLLVIFIVLGLVVLFGIASFTPFIVLRFKPYPTTTSTQTVLQSNTIPLYFGTQAGLPPSFDTYWYDTVTVSLISEPSFPVEIFYVEGREACNPLANRTQVDAFMSPVTPVDPTAQPVDVVVDQYLTAGSTLLANLTLTTNSLANTGSETLTLCILDNRENYEDFHVEDGNCKDVSSLTFPVLNGSVFSVNYTLHESSYFYIILVATTRVDVQFSYQLTYQFYEKTDYVPTSSCLINEDNNWKDCVIKLNGTLGCLFASCPPPVDSAMYADVHVTVHHNILTTKSIIALACGLISIAIFVVIVVFAFVIRWVCRRKEH